MKQLLQILCIFTLYLLPFALTSCDDGGNTLQKSSTVEKNQKKESFEKANRYMMIQEKEAINDYIERHQINMLETGTGLRYRIVKQGDTMLIKRGDVVSMVYEIRLLTGDMLYNSDEDGIKTFLVGKGGVESGLEEAVLNLHRGDVADIIIPSHLAYGLRGDGNRVPKRAALVYKVKIL